MAVVMRLLSAPTPRLSEKMLCALVALGNSLAPMVRLVPAPTRPMHIAQPPPAGPMKWSREPKCVLKLKVLNRKFDQSSISPVIYNKRKLNDFR